MHPAELLAAVRTAQGIPSNYRLARILGVTDKTVSRWQGGENAPDDPMTERLAALAGLDPDLVVVSMRAHREHTPEGRARWERIAQRLERAAVALCAVLAVFASPQDSAASTYDSRGQGQGLTVYTLCAVARRWMAPLFQGFGAVLAVR